MKISDLMQKLENVGYYASTDIAFATMSALDGMPLLVEGAPGTGKTSLAKAISDALKMPLLRVQFYEGLTPEKILYDYNYQAQLLTIEAMKPALENAMKDKTLEEAASITHQMNFYTEEYLIRRPILESISGEKRYVLLLDEIDKSSEEIEYALLEMLDEYSITIPQYGTVTCPKNKRPVVILTSNNYRELSDALRRRCNYLYIRRKTKDEITKILLSKVPKVPEVAEMVSQCIAEIQTLDVKQEPSISEAIQWARYLSENKDGDIDDSVCMLAKHKDDVDMIKSIIRSHAGKQMP